MNPEIGLTIYSKLSNLGFKTNCDFSFLLSCQINEKKKKNHVLCGFCCKKKKRSLYQQNKVWYDPPILNTTNQSFVSKKKKKKCKRICVFELLGSSGFKE